MSKLGTGDRPARPDGASFRDPGDRVFILGERVLRAVMPRAVPDFEFVESTGLVERLVADGRLIGQQMVDPLVLADSGHTPSIVLEHPPIEFVSYPYEWSFPALKAAALLHLDIHLQSLEQGVTLSDASAFNIQFRGTRPIFIDRLSFRRYREGEYWTGHRQFCEQFLNPLLLRSVVGLPANDWYRGRLEGIPAADLDATIPTVRKLSWGIFTHVHLQARLQGRSSTAQAARTMARRKLSLSAFRHILSGLRRWIERLEPRDRHRSAWRGYAEDNTYADAEMQQKFAFVIDFVRGSGAQRLWDVGCNTGEFSLRCLQAGAGSSIGFDTDHQALEAAFARASDRGANFLPLYVDAANPSPGQGWLGRERAGLYQRRRPDAVLALALVHHLAIGRNIPLGEIVDWLVGTAPRGVVEFVPKSDPMVRTLLELREDVFDDYHLEHFVERLERRAHVESSTTVSASGRRLFAFRARADA